MFCVAEDDGEALRQVLRQHSGLSVTYMQHFLQEYKLGHTVTSSPDLHVFGLWEEVGRYGENMQTPHAFSSPWPSILSCLNIYTKTIYCIYVYYTQTMVLEVQSHSDKLQL